MANETDLYNNLSQPVTNEDETLSSGPAWFSFPPAAAGGTLSDVKVILVDSTPADGGDVEVQLYSAPTMPGTTYFQGTTKVADLGLIDDQTLSFSTSVTDVPITKSIALDPNNTYFIKLTSVGGSNAIVGATDNSSGTGVSSSSGSYNNGGTEYFGFPVYPIAEISENVTCFCANTLIRTARGEVAVEDLHVNELAVTGSGAHRPIRWLGHRTIDCRSHPRPSEVLPIRISAHALGEGRPARDLFVSPGHAICVDVLGEVLITAGALVNGSTIQQIEVDEVTYWHVELESHDILLSENMPTESYLEMGNRGFFMDADVVDLAASPDVASSQRTHADFCRPFVDGGPVLEAVRLQLRRRAEAIGWRATDALDMHLVVDGQRLDPVVRGLTARFHLPADAKDVWLMSPTARPSDSLGGTDTRDLGLYIGGLRIDDGFEMRQIAIDDPLLCIGFHAVEDGGRRWTSGRTRLPAALWEGCEGGFYLRIDLAGQLVPRWTAPAVASAEAARPPLAIVA